jgi:hypothetical protein
MKTVDLDKALQEIDPKDGETVLRPAVISGFVFAAGYVLISFGLDLSSDQLNAIATFALFLVPIGAGLWARKKAWSQKSVAMVVEKFNPEVSTEMSTND